MNCSGTIKTGLFMAMLALSGGCGSDKDTGGGNTATTGGNSSAATGGVKASTGGAGPATGGATTAGGASSTGGTAGPSTSGVAGNSGTTGGASGVAGGSSTNPTTGGATSVAGASSTGGATGVAGGSGVAGGTSIVPFMNFIKQAGGTTTATLASGSITLNSAFSASGNAFKYVAPNYYGTSSNGFIAYPTPMNGDFSISAQVNITTETKANNVCGVGLGIATGFNPTDPYAYVVMRHVLNNTNTFYVSGAAILTNSAGPTVPFTVGTPLQLGFSRTGTNVTFSAGPVGGTQTTQTLATSALTDGTNNYGAGAVYPAISFNNVIATVTNLIVKDASGATVYDSATGGLVNYIPAAMTLSQATASMKKGAQATITATASAIGGSISTVSAVAADSTIVDVAVVNGATNSTITLTGLKGGVTTLTVTNTGDANTATNTKTLTVAVNDYATSDPYGALTTVYPAVGATTAYTDGELALTFDSAPTLNVGGSIKIFRASDGAEVDSIAFAGETLGFGSAGVPATNINVGSQLVRVSGNTVYFMPHYGKLAYATAYYVGIPTTSMAGMLNAVTFNGFSDLSTVASWKFTTRAAPTLDATNLTVDGAQASTANFRTIQGALNAVGALATAPAAVNIKVAAGTYNELLRYTGTLGTGQTVRISGPSGNAKGDTCMVQWTNGNAMNGSTQTRASFYFTGANLVLENISFKNTGVRSVVNQAETLYFAVGATPGITLAAFNSSFYSNQDTIQTSGRNWFYNCYIEGNVDFIWGTADAALFENCDLRVIADATGSATYGIFVARTGTTIAATASGTVGKGYVLLNSTVSVDSGVVTYFGRDAGTGAFYDQVALINVAFSGAGTVAPGLWNLGSAYLYMGDGSYVGWKSAGCTGLNMASLTTAANTSTTIPSQSTEYDTRDHILNRVVAVTTGVPSGYAAAATAWDVSTLATAWGVTTP